VSADKLKLSLNITNEAGEKSQVAKEYANVADLSKDFADKTMHPSDFKPWMQKLIKELILTPLDARKKASKPFATSLKILDQASKKLSKK